MGGNKKTKEELVILYNIIMNFLLNCDIQLVLFYGSLLGYYRDNNFINMDDDIDAIISRNDYYILLKYISENKDISINIGINNDSILQLFYNKMGPFDIYIFDYHNDDILIKWDGNLLFKKNDIFPLKKVLFNNFNIFIPNKISDK
jgi:phosphorylcholine metabolism protein LicD